MTKSVSLETKNSLAKNIIRWLTRDRQRLQTLITLLVLILNDNWIFKPKQSIF